MSDKALSEKNTFEKVIEAKDSLINELRQKIQDQEDIIIRSNSPVKDVNIIENPLHEYKRNTSQDLCQASLPLHDQEIQPRVVTKVVSSKDAKLRRITHSTICHPADLNKTVSIKKTDGKFSNFSPLHKREEEKNTQDLFSVTKNLMESQSVSSLIKPPSHK